MKDRYVDWILHGHTLYWDMLGSMRGNNNHKGNVCWLSGDVNFSYDLTVSEPEISEQIKQIIQRIKSGEIPGNLTISPVSAPAGVNLLDCFMKTGLFKMNFQSPGMAKELKQETIFPKPEKRLNIFRINDLWQLKTCGAILNAAFEYDLFSYGHYLDAFNMQDVGFYLAEYDGLPVSACMTISGEDIVEIAWVGTLNGYRKKGIAGYIINAAEKDALQHGKSCAVLTAFEGAVNAYKRIGYKDCCMISVIDYTGDRLNSAL